MIHYDPSLPLPESTLSTERPASTSKPASKSAEESPSQPVFALLEARSVKRRTRNAVINIKAIVFVAVVKCIALKDLFLVDDTVAVALQFIVTRQTAVQSGNSFDAHSVVRELKRGSGV